MTIFCRLYLLRFRDLIIVFLFQYWGIMRSNAKQVACSNGKARNIPTGGGAPDDEEQGAGFTTEDPLVDRIMDLLGWHLALGVGVEDELESLIVVSSPNSPDQSLSNISH